MSVVYVGDQKCRCRRDGCIRDGARKSADGFELRNLQPTAFPLRLQSQFRNCHLLPEQIQHDPPHHQYILRRMHRLPPDSHPSRTKHPTPRAVNEESGNAKASNPHTAIHALPWTAIAGGGVVACVRPPEAGAHVIGMALDARRRSQMERRYVVVTPFQGMHGADPRRSKPATPGCEKKMRQPRRLPHGVLIASRGGRSNGQIGALSFDALGGVRDAAYPQKPGSHPPRGSRACPRRRSLPG